MRVIRRALAVVVVCIAGAVVAPSSAFADCVGAGAWTSHAWDNNLIFFQRGGCRWQDRVFGGLSNGATANVFDLGVGMQVCSGTFQRSVGLVGGVPVNGNLVFRGTGANVIGSTGPGAAFGVGVQGKLGSGAVGPWFNDVLAFYC
jgi:hypothetical protein